MGGLQVPAAGSGRAQVRGRTRHLPRPLLLHREHLDLMVPIPWGCGKRCDVQQQRAWGTGNSDPRSLTICGPLRTKFFYPWTKGASCPTPPVASTALPKGLPSQVPKVSCERRNRPSSPPFRVLEQLTARPQSLLHQHS